VIDTDGDVRGVVGDVVDAVGDCLAVSGTGEVVGVDRDGFPAAVPLPPGLGEPADEFLLLGVHADHGLTSGQGGADGVVDVAELGVTVGVLGAFEGLTGALQAVPASVKDLRDDGVGDGVTGPGQFRCEVAGRLRRPP